MKTFKSLKKFDDIKEELYDYCRKEVLKTDNYYLDWCECCDKAREKMKGEGLTEDDDEYLFYEYAEDFWDEFVKEYVKELYDGAKDFVFYDYEDNENLRFVSDFEDDFRKPIDAKYTFEVFYSLKDYIDYSAGLCSLRSANCCFLEDTIPFNDEEVKAALRERGVWKTAWQWLAQDKKKVKYNSEPEERYNWLYDRDTDSFEKAKKPFYYYSEYDTVEVSEEEYEELKSQYISRFGGWEKIDLEHTDYDGRKWY